jgi:Ca2+-binding RTX toxin-like protein
LQQWTGNGTATIRLTIDGTDFDFSPASGQQDLGITKYSGDYTMAITLAEPGHDAGTYSYDTTTHTYTLYVATTFDTVDITYESGSPGFNINNITYDLNTTIQDMSMNFSLTATDGDGDSSTLNDTLAVAMVDPSNDTLTASSDTSGSVDPNGGVVLVGDSHDETIIGGDGNDILTGHGGSDTMTGGLGSDTFRWYLGDAAGSPEDIITDFHMSQGDVLDLRDLLVGEDQTATSGPTDLINYLSFAESGSDVIVTVTTNDSSSTTQTILLQGVTLADLSGDASHTTSADIIHNMLQNGNLLTD